MKKLANLLRQHNNLNQNKPNHYHHFYFGQIFAQWQHKNLENIWNFFLLSFKFEKRQKYGKTCQSLETTDLTNKKRESLG
jgi:hypothetical protein